MSHSRIFQLSSKRIAKEDYASSSDFYDNHYDFADYIGDEIEDDEEREEEIKKLAVELKDIFDLSADGKSLVYKGKDAMREFCEQWAKAFSEAATKVTSETILGWKARYDVRSLCGNTHLQSDRRFCLGEYSYYASPMSELIEYMSDFKAGKKIYVGAIIDYHY